MNLLPQKFIKEVIVLKKRQKAYLKLTKSFLVLGFIFLLFSFAPAIWYSLATSVDDFSEALLATAKKADDHKIGDEVEEKIAWQPAFDQRLTRETRLIIPKIGVDTKVVEATIDNYEEALKQGVWRASDFGTPQDRQKPMILAAHRFGYLTWTNIYRRQNSFYNLPKLKKGDLIEIIYRQRKYTYEIYDESRGEEIIDYEANLILYTCETLNSKVRIFKYAKLLQI